VQNLLSGLQYRERSAVEIQILQLLHQIHSLRPQIDNYVFNDGTHQQLFKLEGTIPIQYRAKQYNIPVAVWLPLNFPTACPICYVTPVPGMKIKPKHMHVDGQGLVYHPYLHSWKGQQSNLVELVGTLCSVFGKDPPLFASKSKPVQQPPQQHQPPPPQSQPPLPSYSNAQSYAANSQPQMHGRAHAQSLTHSQSVPHSQPQPPPPAQPVPLPQQPQAQAQPQQQQDVQADRRSELESKLRTKLQSIYDAENQKLNTLASSQRQLENHAKSIRDIQQKQSEEREQLLQRRQKLQIKIEATEQWLQQHENNEAIDVHQAVMATDTWSQQCMEAEAAVHAITDVMLELDQCLEDETIKLDTYLKQLSKTAREQFQHQALAKAVLQRQASAAQHANPALYH